MPSARVIRLAVVCAGVALALSVSALSSPTPPAGPPAPGRAAVGPPTAALSVDPLDLDRLERYASGAREPNGPRNPFRFVVAEDTRAPLLSGAARQGGSPAVARAAAADEPEQLAPLLVGIAIVDPAQGRGSTAVFTNGDGTIEFGGLGDVVAAGRYRIRAFAGDTVTLVSTRTGVLTSLTLR